MDYPFGEDNWICRLFGHRLGKPYRSAKYVPCDPPGSVYWDGVSREGPVRRTCSLCGHTIPPFPKLSQKVDP